MKRIVVAATVLLCSFAVEALAETSAISRLPSENNFEHLLAPSAQTQVAQGHSCSAYPWYRKCKTQSSHRYCCSTIRYDVPNCICD